MNIGMTLAQLEYRNGFIMMDIAQAAAVRIVSIMPHLVFGLLAFLIIPSALRVREGHGLPPQREKNMPSALLAFCIAAALLFLAGWAVCFVGAIHDSGLLSAAFFSAVMVVLGGIVFVLLAVPAAAASASFRRPIIPAVLVLFSGLSGGPIIHFMLGYAIGGVNSIALPAFWSAAELLPLVVFIAYFFYLDAQRALRYSIPFVGLALQAVLTNLVYPLVFLSNMSKAPLPLLMRQMQITYTGRGSSPAPLLALVLFSLALWAACCAWVFAAPTIQGEQAVPGK